MRILYHIPNPQGMGADRWIYEGWRDAFADMGNQVYEHTVYDELEQKVRDVQSAVFYWCPVGISSRGAVFGDGV